MAELDILQPQVLNGVLSGLPPKQNLVMLGTIPTEQTDEQSAVWDIEGPNGRTAGDLNVQGAEALVVPRLRSFAMSERFAYFREKKLIPPTVAFNARQLGSLTARTRAEARVTQELQNLKDRANNLAELLIWKALTGRLIFSGKRVSIDVDYHFPTTHKPVVAKSWTDPTIKVQDITNDILTMIRLIEDDSGVTPTDVYVDRTVIDLIVTIFVNTTTAGSGLLTEAARQAYFATGTLNDWMGLNWHSQKNTFDPSGSEYSGTPLAPGAQTRFESPSLLIMGDFTTNSPIQLTEGPSADWTAGQDYIGQFAKSWESPDPSGQEILVEWNFLPTITRPSQFISATVRY